MATPVTHALAEFALGLQWAQLPPKVQSEAVRAFLNWVGCAVGGANTATVDAALRGVAGYASNGATPILGRRERAGLADAAIVNTLSSAAHTFDDTHLATITHPTGPVAAALLAYAGAHETSGEELLLALVIGMEVECRISAAMVAPDTGGIHQGWYITGVSGGIGVAAGVGRLMGMTHAQLVSALGLAATQACGLRATHGSMAIAWVPALAARNGLNAAYMAKADFICSDIAIDGRNGLLEVMSPGADAANIRRDLGSAFELLGNAYKPYPCGIVIHAAIDACLEIALKHAPPLDDIDRVDLEVHRDALNLTWRKLPATVLDAQVSLYHWAACALVFAEAGLAQGELSSIENSRVRALQSRMFAAASDKLASDQAVVTVRLKSGAVLRAEIAHGLGSLARPMTDAQLEAKFRMLAKRALDESRIDALLKSCWQLGSLAGAAQIGRLGAL